MLTGTTTTKHMRKTATFILTILLYSFSYGQTITELYNNKNYQELVKLEKKADKLTPDELYMVGFAFFQLESDNKAIEFYDKAIAKGLDNGLDENLLKASRFRKRQVHSKHIRSTLYILGV